MNIGNWRWSGKFTNWSILKRLKEKESNLIKAVAKEEKTTKKRRRRKMLRRKMIQIILLTVLKISNLILRMTTTLNSLRTRENPLKLILEALRITLLQDNLRIDLIVYRPPRVSEHNQALVLEAISKFKDQISMTLIIGKE